MQNRVTGRFWVDSVGRAHLSLLGGVVMLLLTLGFVMVLRVPAQAGLTSLNGNNSCLTSGCHNTLSSTGSITGIAVNGTSGASVTTIPGSSFQLDWKFSILGSKSSVGTMVLVPTNWTVGTGSATAPALTPWSTTWDQTDGVGWSQNCNATGDAAGGANTVCYAVNYVNSAWDAGSRDTALDNTTAVDGASNSMGTDAAVTVPSSATAGSYTVKAFGIGHDGNSRSYAVQNVTVTVKPVVTSTSPGSMPQGAGPTTVTINGSGFTNTGLSVSFSGSGISAGTPTYVSSSQITVPVTVAAGATIGTGNVTVTCSGQSGTGTGVFSVTAGLQNQATLSVTGPSSITYPSTGQITTTGGSGTGAMSYNATGTGCTVNSSSGVITVTNASGTCSVSATKAGDATYNPTTSASFSVSLVKGTPSVSAWPTAGAITYGQPLSSSTLSGGSASAAGSFTFTAPSTVPTAGTASQGVTFTPTDTNNYTAVTGSTSVTVNKASLTVTANNASKTYGSANPALTVSYSGFVNGDTAASLTTQPTASTTATDSSPAGSYAITASGGVSSNYTFSYVAGTLTVNAASLTVTANAQSKVYGATDPVLTYTYSGLVNGDTGSVFTGSLARVAGSGVGTYAINQGTLDAGANYTITYTGSNLTVTPASLTVTANDASKSYGSANPALTVSYSGFVNGDTATSLPTQPTASTTATASSPAGSYAITANGGVSPNYTFGYVAGTLTVDPAALSVTANAQMRTYGAADPVLTYTYSGLVNGDTASVFSGSLTRVAGSTIGTYAINQGTLSAGANYTIAYTGADLTVTAAPLTVSAAAKSKGYGMADPTLTYTATGFVNGDTVAIMTGSLARVAGENVGTYAINQGNVSAGANYTIAYTGADLTVTAAPLTVTADDVSKVAGTANPTLTYTPTGFVNGDTAAVLSGTPTLSTTATTASPAGAYPITVSAGTLAAANYSFGFVNGTLTVTAAPDTAAPTVTSFTLPATSTTLAVTVASLAATDDVGVTGYLITENGTQPSAGAAGWTASVPTSFTFSGTGSKTAYAWAKDGDGNVSASLSATVLIDTTGAPVIGSVTPASNGYVNNATVGYTLSKDVASGSVAFTQTGGTADPTSPHVYTMVAGDMTAGSHSVNTGIPLVNGAIYTVSFNAVDAVGNAAVEVDSTTIHYDATAASVTLSAPAAGSRTNNALTSYSLSKQVQSGQIVYTWTGGTADGASPHTYALTGSDLVAGSHAGVNTGVTLADGAVYTVSVQNVVDLEGNGSTTVANASVTYDSTAVAITGTTPAAGSSVATAVVGYTLSEQGQSGSVTFTRTGGTPDPASPQHYVMSGADLAAGTHGNLDTALPLVSGAVYTVSFDAVDQAGNPATTVSNALVTFDTAAPAVFDFTMPATSTVLTVNITSFTVTDNVGVSGYLITENATAPTAGTTGWTATAPTTYTVATAGTYTLYPWVMDAAGNVSAVYGTPASLTVTAGTAPGTIIVSTPPLLTRGTSATFGFTSDDLQATFECKLDAQSFAACTSPVNLSSLMDGSHSFTVRAKSQGGVYDPNPPYYIWTVDTTPPTGTGILTKPTDPTAASTAQFTFSNSEPTATFECSIDGRAYQVCTSPATYAALVDGAHTFSVRAVDAAGNGESVPVAYTWNVAEYALLKADGQQDAYFTTVGEALTTLDQYVGPTGVQLMLKGRTFSEWVTCNLPDLIHLGGGYGDGFSGISWSNPTVIAGLTIGQCAVIINNVAIK